MVWGFPRDVCPASEAQGGRALVKGAKKRFLCFSSHFGEIQYWKGNALRVSVQGITY